MPLSKSSLDLLDSIRDGGGGIRQIGEAHKPIPNVESMPAAERTRKVAEILSRHPAYDSGDVVEKYVSGPFSQGLVDFGGVLHRGARAVGSDAFGAEGERWMLSAASQAQDISAERTDSKGPVASVIQRGARGALRSTAGALIPAVAGSLVGAGTAFQLVGGGLIAGEQAYTDAVEKGYEKPLQHAVNQGGAEILIAAVFQKIGLGGMEKYYGPAGKQFVAQAAKSTAKEVAKRLGKDVLAELTEEELTTIYQTLTTPDKISGLQAGQSAWTHEDGSLGYKEDPTTGRKILPPMLEAIVDTAAQTILQTGGTAAARAGIDATALGAKKAGDYVKDQFRELPMRPTEKKPQPKKATDFPIGSIPKLSKEQAAEILPPGAVVVAHDNGKVVIETPNDGKKKYDPTELEPQFTPYKHLQSFAHDWMQNNPEAATKLLQAAAKSGGTPSIKDFEAAGLDRRHVTQEQRKEFATWLSEVPPPRAPISNEQIAAWLDEPAPGRVKRPPVQMLGPKPTSIEQVNVGDFVTIGDDDYARVLGTVDTGGNMVLVEGSFGRARVDLRRITSHRAVSQAEDVAVPPAEETPNVEAPQAAEVPVSSPEPGAIEAPQPQPTLAPPIDEQTSATGFNPAKNPEAAGVPMGQPAVAPTPAAAAPPADDLIDFNDSPDVVLAHDIADVLASGGKLDRDTFWNLADTAHGGSRAEGKYGPSDAYDSLELGVNLSLQGKTNPTADAAGAKKEVATLQNVVNSLPSQTNRSGEKITMQQFSTPPSYGYAVAWLANIQPTDVVLEPSAGTGSLLVQAQNANPKAVYANEWSERRAKLVEQLGPVKVFNDDAEQAANILPGLMPAPTVVLMNPPFSHAGKRLGDKKVIGTDLKHIDQMLKLLAPGGRVVAIIGAPLHAEAGDTKTFSDWYRQQAKTHNIRANVMVGRDVYKGYGTTFPTRVLVIDKTGPTETTIKGEVADLPELIDLLDEVRNDRLKQKPVQSGGAKSPGDVGSGGGTGREPAVRPGVGTVGDAQRPATGERGNASEPSGSSKPTAATGSGANPSVSDAPSGRPLGGKRPGTGGKRGEVAGKPQDGAGEGGSPGGRRLGEPTANDAASAGTADASPGLDTSEMTPEQMAKFLREQGGKRFGAPKAEPIPSKPTPPVKPGFVRMFHGGIDPDGDRRDVTQNYEYAKGYAEKGNNVDKDGPKVWYVDIPLDHPSLSKSFDDSGTGQTAPFNPFTVDEELSKQFKRYVPSADTGKKLGTPAVPKVEAAPASTTPKYDVAKNKLADVLAKKKKKPTETGSDDVQAMAAEWDNDIWDAVVDVTTQAVAEVKIYDFADYVKFIAKDFGKETTAELAPYIESAWDTLKSIDRSNKLGPTGDVDAILNGPKRTPKPEPKKAETKPAEKPAAVAEPESIQETVKDTIAENKEVAKRDELGEAVFEPYAPSKLKVPGSVKHKGSLVESVAMGAVEAPDISYAVSLPRDMIESGMLSEAQLEQTYYAGQAHEQMLKPDKNGVSFRRGYMIGDGTGVGKGREIASIILDNLKKGRKKAVWISKNTGLFKDAVRDWGRNGLQQDESKIYDHSKAGTAESGGPVKVGDGILFTTYGTLKSTASSAASAKGNARSRVDQIVEWVGKDFDGVIAFDEAHMMGSAVEAPGTQGKKKASDQALAGIELQERLPNARIVYVSATSATEVYNLGYAPRLGLWGKGTAFADVNDFIAKIAAGGIAAMELVARDLKAMGLYLARSLSYNDGTPNGTVTFGSLKHALTSEQKAQYNRVAQGWQVVLANIEAAIGITGASRAARTAATSAFWIAELRFFSQYTTNLQLPSVLDDIEAKLAERGPDGKPVNSVVIQLTNTDESLQERELAKREKGDEDFEEFSINPMDGLLQMIDRSFPTQQYEDAVDDNGKVYRRPVVRNTGKKDSDGNPIMEPVHNAEALALKNKMMEDITSIASTIPGSPVDQIINRFGHEVVAEVTGRKRRIINMENSKGEIVATENLRTKEFSNASETANFQGGKKRVLIFSEAGGTGSSYHASNEAENKQKRIHYLLQAGWKASTAVQGFGRTHRTNQAQAPHYVLVSTDLSGQKRFISTIARRLAQLGALTKGQRQTGFGSGKNEKNQEVGMFTSNDNLEGKDAADSLRIFFERMRDGKTSISLQEMIAKTHLKLIDPMTGGLYATLPKMSQVLNRILILDFDTQNKVFDEFFDLHAERVERMRANGTLDDGVENVKAESVKILSDTVVRTDAASGAKTRYVKLVVHEKTNPVTFDSIVFRQPQYFVNHKGKIYAVFDSSASRTDTKTGTAVPQLKLTSPSGGKSKYEDADKVPLMGKLTEQEARPIWNEQLKKVPATEAHDMHMIVGLILPIWDKLTGDTQVRRVLTDSGDQLLGRVIPTLQVPKVLEGLGISADGKQARPVLTAAEAVARVMDDGHVLHLDHGHLDWKVKKVRVQNEVRMELIGPTFTNEASLLQDGLFKEVIQSKARWFIPTDSKAEAVMERILEQYPLKDIRRGKDTDSLPLRIGTPAESDDVQAMTATATPPGKGRIGAPRALPTPIANATPAPQTIKNSRNSPGAPVIPVGMETTPGSVLSAYQIIATMGRWFGVPLRTGRLGMQNALGIYKKLARVVRFDRQADADLAVATHEIAHHIDQITRLTAGKAYGFKIGRELKALDYDVVAGRTPLQAGRHHEGFAEFMRHYLTTDHDTIRVVAPKFFDYFDNVFLPAHPEIARSLEASKSLIDRWRQQGAANRVEAGISKTGVQDGPIMSWSERVPEWIRRTFNDVYVRWKDKGHTIKRFDAAARQHGWKMPNAGTPAYALLSAYDQAGPSAAARAIDDGVFSVTDGRRLSKGLREVLSSINKDEYEEFRRFLWARHSQEVHMKGRSLPDGGKAPMNPGMSLQDANWIVGEVWADREKGERFLEAAKGVTQFNQALLDMLVDAGVITNQSADRMKAYWQTYVPLMRARDAKSGVGLGKKFVDLPPAVRGRYGSGRQIIDPIESTIQQAAQFFDRAYKQQVMLQLIAEGDPRYGGAEGMGEWIDRVPPKTVVTRVNLGEVWPAITKKLLEFGIEEDLNVDRRMLEQLGDQFIDDWVNIYRTDHSPDPKNNIIRIVRDDKPLLYQINKELYQALEGMDRIQVPSFLKIFSMVNKLRRLGATGLNTMFAGANVVRDWVTFQFQTRHSNGLESTYSPFYWIASYIRASMHDLGFENIGKNDETVKLWKEMGGQLSTKLGLDRPGLAKMRHDIVAHSTPAKLRELLVHPLDTFRDVISISDVGPRLAEFAGVLRKHGYIRNKKGQIVNKKTGNPERPPRSVLVEAINAANDVTVNFKRMGSQGRWVNEFYLFFNASLESIDKTGRTLTAAYKGEENVRQRVLVAMAAMASASLLYWIARSDDDDYEEEEDWLKHGYWTLPDETGKPLYRVPKPYEWGFVANMVEGIASSLKKESIEPFKQAVIGQAEKMTPGGNGLTGIVNGVSLVGTAFETAFNYDTFRGQEIENESLQGLKPGDRATPYNTETSKAIGGYMNISPAKTDHFLNGITGGGYNRVVGGGERVLQGEGINADIPGYGAFVVKKDYAKSITDFYDRAESLRQDYNSAKLQGTPEDSLSKEYHNYEDFRAMMAEIRAPIRGETDRDKRFEVEKYLVGLSREVLGEKPLERYPSPFDVPPAELPLPVRKAVLSYRKRLVERVKENPPKRKLGEQPEAYAKRVHDYRILRSRSVEMLRRLRPAGVL